MRRVQHAIVAHPGLQAVAFVALVCLYIWALEPVASNATRLLCMAFFLAMPVVSNLLHRDRVRDLGLRVDNLRQSGREVGAATLYCSLMVVVGSLALGWGSTLTLGSALGGIAYVVWGFSQQYLLQSFVYRRLRDSLRDSQRASVAAALLFGVTHLPNPVLVVGTTVAGYMWCRAFERAPNLLTLAASHAWLATMLMAHVPAEVLHTMRVGPGFWG